jgi:hypothetical protein
VAPARQRRPRRSGRRWCGLSATHHLSLFDFASICTEFKSDCGTKSDREPSASGRFSHDRPVRGRADSFRFIPGPERMGYAQNVASQDRPEIPRVERQRVRLQQKEFTLHEAQATFP